MTRDQQIIELVANHPGKTATELSKFCPDLKPGSVSAKLTELARGGSIARREEPDSREMAKPVRLTLRRLNGNHVNKAWRYYPVSDHPKLFEL